MLLRDLLRFVRFGTPLAVCWDMQESWLLYEKNWPYYAVPETQFENKILDTKVARFELRSTEKDTYLLIVLQQN